jgi:pre-mRNA-processing factor 19
MAVVFCSLSGLPAREPVLSPVSHKIYERSLIEKHIAATGTDPSLPNTQLAVEDLVPIDLSSANNGVSPPRLPEAASIPILLSALQNEFDASALEIFNLRNELANARKELAQMMYQHDAACRVISRLVQERDQALQLASGGNLRNEDVEMQVENMPPPAAFPIRRASPSSPAKKQLSKLNEEIVEELVHYATSVSKDRKKRWKEIPEDLLSASHIASLESIGEFDVGKGSGISASSILEDSNEVLVLGHSNGIVRAVDFSSGKLLASTTLKSSSSTRVNSVDVASAGAPLVVAGADDGVVRMWTYKKTKFEAGTSFSNHNDAVTAVAFQPTNKYIVSASRDQTWCLYDVAIGGVLNQFSEEPLTYSTVGFHPDGLLLALGAEEGHIRVWDLKTQTVAETLDKASKTPVTSLHFCENGYYLASGDHQGTVKIWDLRKLAIVKEFTAGSSVASVRFNPTGHYLGVASDDSGLVFSASDNFSHVHTFSREGSLTGFEISRFANKFGSFDDNGTVAIWG